MSITTNTGPITFYRGEDPLRANKLNEAFSERVLRLGDTMVGKLVLAMDPVDALDAVTKQYVDRNFIMSLNAAYLPLLGGTMQGFILLNADPIQPMHAATRQYVDAKAASGAVDWSTITGKPSTFPPTLPIPESGVTNLVADLASKEPTITGGTTAQYWRGDKTWVTFPAIPAASSTLPLVEGTAAIGVSLTYARSDHVHPSGGAAGGASVTVSDTPPASPAQGDLWFSGTDTQLYLRYNDGSSAQWVVANNQFSSNSFLTDAPNDGFTYARRSISWQKAFPVAPRGSLIVGPMTEPGTVIVNSHAFADYVSTSAIGYNIYNDGSSWRRIQSGYGSQILLDRPAGKLYFSIFDTGAPNTVQGASVDMTLDYTTGTFAVTSGRIMSVRSGLPSVGVYDTSGSGYACGMYYDAAGPSQLRFGQLNSSGGLAAYWGLVSADGFTTNGGFVAAGNVQGNIVLGTQIKPNSSLSTDYILYGDANLNIAQYAAGYYWSYQRNSGQLNWYSNNSQLWSMRVTPDWLCWNNIAVVGGVGAYLNLSDERAKTGIAPADAGLAEVLKIVPISYNRLTKNAEGGTIVSPRIELGFSAQQLQTVLPEAVYLFGVELPDGSGGMDTDEPSLGVQSEMITAALVNAIKTLTARIEVLEAR